jgi:hypothetical protein
LNVSGKEFKLPVRPGVFAPFPAKPVSRAFFCLRVAAPSQNAAQGRKIREQLQAEAWNADDKQNTANKMKTAPKRGCFHEI